MRVRIDQREEIREKSIEIMGGEKEIREQEESQIREDRKLREKERRGEEAMVVRGDVRFCARFNVRNTIFLSLAMSRLLCLQLFFLIIQLGSRNILTIFSAYYDFLHNIL
jgi:hypothetical protein